MIEPFLLFKYFGQVGSLKLVFDPFVNMFSYVSDDLFNMGILKIGKTMQNQHWQVFPIIDCMYTCHCLAGIFISRGLRNKPPIMYKDHIGFLVLSRHTHI